MTASCRLASLIWHANMVTSGWKINATEFLSYIVKNRDTTSINICDMLVWDYTYFLTNIYRQVCSVYFPNCYHFVDRPTNEFPHPLARMPQSATYRVLPPPFHYSKQEIWMCDFFSPFCVGSCNCSIFFREKNSDIFTLLTFSYHILFWI